MPLPWSQTQGQGRDRYFKNKRKYVPNGQLPPIGPEDGPSLLGGEGAREVNGCKVKDDKDGIYQFLKGNMLKSSNMNISFDDPKHMSKKNHNKEKKNKHFYNAFDVTSISHVARGE